PLPPIFVPQTDATQPAQTVGLFGSVDAAYTVLRIARRSGVCQGGGRAGLPCAADTDCPSGGTCHDVCVGGSDADALCPPSPCTGGACGRLYANFGPLTNGGPLVLPRAAGAGICQVAPHAACSNDGNCPAVGDRCVEYAFEAQTPVPLESLSAGTDDLFAFTALEAADGVDRNGDSDTIDPVAVLQDRATGAGQALGAPAGCGIAGTPPGRAAILVQRQPFQFPAVAIENDLAAFLESESAEKYCDENGDFDRLDPILRVFRLGPPGPGEAPTELTAGLTPPHVADPTPLVAGRSLVVSNGRVFVRRPEAGQAHNLTARGSVAAGGDPNPDAASTAGPLSMDGRFLAFTSAAQNLGPPAPSFTSGLNQVFVRDRQTGTNELESVGVITSPGNPAFGDSFADAISRNGRFVVFDSQATNIAPLALFSGCDVFIRDRGTMTSEIVSNAPGTEANRMATCPL